MITKKILPNGENSTTAHAPVGISTKMQAFLDMQEMRKASVNYNFSESERDSAIAEKYGEIRWGRLLCN